MSDQIKENAKNIQSLTSDLAGLTSVVTGLTGSVERLINLQEKNSKTNWSTLASWAAVIISIVSYLNHLNIVPIQHDLQERRASDIRLYDYHNQQELLIYGNKIDIARIEERAKALKSIIEKIETEQKRRTSKVYKTTL